LTTGQHDIFRKQKTPKLYNEYSIEKLTARLAAEQFSRKTVSFYRYVKIDDPTTVRNALYSQMEALGVLGRIYLASEGVNAQASIPEHNYEYFLEGIRKLFPDIPMKIAVEESTESFFKLVVKVRTKILADGLSDDAYDVSNVGKHLNAKEFNEALAIDGAIVVDVRNYFESEIGHFHNALRPNVDSFRDELPVISEMLAGQQDKKVLLYCTGGIRCEKASAWLKHQGFRDVNQLHGGIIDYARQVKAEGLENKFIGKNFVFDARMGEKITEEVISHCHQCGKPADSHTNCRWAACHLLYIQCDECAVTMGGCCTPECRANLALPCEERERVMREMTASTPAFFRSRRRPQGHVKLQQ
jgi:UPF0176 protein